MRTLELFAVSIQILLLFSTQILTAANKTPTSRIFGGDEIDISQAKFVVQIKLRVSDNMYKKCGGSLVTPFYVITAAHCVQHIPLANILVTGGATYYNGEGLRRLVLEKHIPENQLLDIAVLRLETPLEGPNIETIELCNTPCKPGDLVNVYGWGKISPNDSMTDRKLREVQVPVLDDEECKLYFDPEFLSNYFCAGVIGAKNCGRGDSGGPAAFNNCLCGVVSAGIEARHLGLYVDISSVESFIMRFIES